MEYGRLLRDAWRITWRHPFLWLLGLFAGGTAGLSFNFNGGSSGRGGGPGGPPPEGLPSGMPIPGTDIGPATIAAWMADHLGLILAVAALLVLLGLVMLVVSLIAQGGLTGATAEYASGRRSSLGAAWRTGVRLFWRFAGLWLLLVLAGLLIAAVVAGFVAAVIGLSALVENAAWVVAPAVLIGLVLVVAGIAAGVVVSIVVPFAQRAIAVHDLGPVAALRDGWQTLREHPGASLLVWLLNLALTIAAGLVITLAMLVAVAVLAVPALILWGMFELTAPTVVYGIVAAVAAFGMLLALASVSNTFFWSYWTLAYLRLRGEAPGEVTG